MLKIGLGLCGVFLICGCQKSAEPTGAIKDFNDTKVSFASGFEEADAKLKSVDLKATPEATDTIYAWLVGEPPAYKANVIKRTMVYTYLEKVDWTQLQEPQQVKLTNGVVKTLETDTTNIRFVAVTLASKKKLKEALPALEKLKSTDSNALKELVNSAIENINKP